VVAGFVPGQEDQMIALIGATVFGLVTVTGNVNFAPNNGFHSVFTGDVVKLNGSKEITVVRQCQSRHLLLGSSLDDRLQGIRPIQETVMAVQVKMDEFAHRIRFLVRSLFRSFVCRVIVSCLSSRIVYISFIAPLL